MCSALVSLGWRRKQGEGLKLSLPKETGEGGDFPTVWELSVLPASHTVVYKHLDLSR